MELGENAGLWEEEVALYLIALCYQSNNQGYKLKVKMEIGNLRRVRRRYKIGTPEYAICELTKAYDKVSTEC